MSGSMRRESLVPLTINGVKYRKVVIDSHYEKKHSGPMNDRLIVELVKRLDGRAFRPSVVLNSGYLVFVNDPWLLDAKAYRLIWTTHPDKSYVGVINAFRRKYGKKG